jgi:hypothetical protein
MPSVTYGNAVFGLRDIKITNSDNDTQEDLGAAVTAEFVPQIVGGGLEGDDAMKAWIAFITHGVLNFSSGEYSSAAVAIMLGLTLTTSGTTPNEETTLQIDEGTRLPYFRLYAQAYDEDAGDIHLLCYKVKLTAIPGMMKLENGNWRMNEFEAVCLDDGSNGVVQIVQNETATAVPSTA